MNQIEPEVLTHKSKKNKKLKLSGPAGKYVSNNLNSTFHSEPKKVQFIANEDGDSPGMRNNHVISSKKL